MSGITRRIELPGSHKAGVHSAIVVTQFKGATPGFVLVGRSIREVEQREVDIQHLVILGWLALLVVSILATLLLFRKSSKEFLPS